MSGIALHWDKETQSHRHGTEEENALANSLATDETAMAGISQLNRMERNSRISACDWMVLGDRVCSQEWLDYRQALRDITSHERWPDLRPQDWPTEPE